MGMKQGMGNQHGQLDQECGNRVVAGFVSVAVQEGQVQGRAQGRLCRKRQLVVGAWPICWTYHAHAPTGIKIQSCRRRGALPVKGQTSPATSRGLGSRRQSRRAAAVLLRALLLPTCCRLGSGGRRSWQRGWLAAGRRLFGGPGGVEVALQAQPALVIVAVCGQTVGMEMGSVGHQDDCHAEQNTATWKDNRITQ